MAESFKPLTLKLAQDLVGKELPGLLQQWRRLYHHAVSIQDLETAEFLGACIKDLEGIQTRTYCEPSTKA